MHGELRFMAAQVNFRAATEDDSSHLAILADAASRRLVSHMWSGTARVGQSSFEVGREAIRINAGHFTHYANWQVAECDGRIAGGLNGYLLPSQTDAGSSADIPALLRPLSELKSVAAGTWYISTASVFPEFRNRGVGDALLVKAETLTRAQDISRLTLMVGSFNEGARRLYQRFGFAEWERRSFIPFEGSDPEGDWILMVKDVM
jgi:ribosomal protein S18 acetylase RimI-like enzyme